MSIIYPMILSTTEPNNYIGVVKIRQYDEGTQVFDVTVTENNKPKDFTGLTPFFCVKNGDHIGLGISEQKVTDVDPENGKLRYTVTNYDMQHTGEMIAYFSFRELKKDPAKEDLFQWRTQFSTKDFSYTVVKGLYSGGIKDSNYIWTFEEILRYFQQWVEESMKTYDDWYIEAQKELERIIKEFQTWIGTNQDIYDAWLDSQQLDFDRWQNANKDDFQTWFNSLKEILDENAAGNLQNQLDNIRPSKEVLTINHNIKGYPKLRVLYWEYGLATRSLENEPTGIGGGNVRTIESSVEYLDPYSLTVNVPSTYRPVDPQLIFVDNNRFRLISDYKILQVELLEPDISAYVEQTVTLDFKGKVSGSFSENPHKIIGDRGTVLPDPKTLQGDTSTAGYKKFAELDGNIVNVVATEKNEIMKIVASFDLVTDIDRRHPGLFDSYSATTTAQKVVVVNQLVKDISIDVYGYGSGASGNRLSLDLWSPISKKWSSNWKSHVNTVITRLTLATSLSNLIDSEGMLYLVVYAPASDGATPSVVNIDYVSLEYKLKVGGI